MKKIISAILATTMTASLAVNCFATQSSNTYEAETGVYHCFSNVYQTITQNTAGSIIFDCAKGIVDIYVSNENYSVDFLKDKKKSNKYDGKYIGSLDI